MKEIDRNKHSETEILKTSEFGEISQIENTVVDILAESVSRKIPGSPMVHSKLEGNQFFCDFDLPDNASISSNDLPAFTKSMVEIITTANISSSILPISEALTYAETDTHKKSILLASVEEKVSIHSINGHILIPREGNSLQYPNILTEDNFLLSGVSGVYWQGSEKNKMIQRIRGVVFKTDNKKKNI